MKNLSIEDLLYQIIFTALEDAIIKHNFLPNTPTTEKEEFLDAKKSAEFIGESLSSFYRRTSQREIPFYKRGKKIFCKKSELEKWLEEGKKKTRAEIRREVA